MGGAALCCACAGRTCRIGARSRCGRDLQHANAREGWGRMCRRDRWWGGGGGGGAQRRRGAV